MKKIINDTLKSPNGKWSRKSLTMLVSFLVTILLGIKIVFTKEVNTSAIDVFQGFLLLVGALSGITVWDKQNINNKNNENE